MTDVAVSVQGVSKSFRIYSEHNQSLKATVMRRKRASYEEFWALRDVSFDVPVGTTFGLMGDNGSGKSTLLKCIAKILQPNEGRIVSQGRMASMLELGSGFHPELTGRENVYLNGSILGMSRKELDAKFDEIADFAGVGAFIDQPVKNYSSGMYVRLGFSVAIHVEPDILLVDEILAVGDMSFQAKCKEKFAEFKQQGRTVVVVSHGLGDMRTFCDTAAWLSHGTVVDTGPAAGIVDRYLDVGHQARAVESGGTRYGTGEISVDRVELLDDHGNDVRTMHTGDDVTVRLHWRATRPVTRPVFSVSVHTVEGMHIWNHHTRDAEYIPQTLSGSGTIDVRLPGLRLLKGTYDLYVALKDETLSVVFDHWARAARFDVLRGTPREAGLVAMGSRWGNLQPPTPMALDNTGGDGDAAGTVTDASVPAVTTGAHDPTAADGTPAPLTAGGGQDRR